MAESSDQDTPPELINPGLQGEQRAEQTPQHAPQLQQQSEQQQLQGFGAFLEDFCRHRIGLPPNATLRERYAPLCLAVDVLRSRARRLWELLQGPDSNRLLEALAFWLVRALKEAGYPKEKARLLVLLLARDARRLSDEAEALASLAVRAYDEADAKVLLHRENIGRFRDFRDVLVGLMEGAGYNNEDALNRSLIVLVEMGEKLGVLLDKRTVAVKVKSNRFYANDPLRGMVVISQRLVKTRTTNEGGWPIEVEDWIFDSEPVAKCFVETVKVLKNPITGDIKFSVSFGEPVSRRPILDKPLTGTISEIASELRERGLAPNSLRLADVLSAVVTAFREKGLDTWEAWTGTTGFVYLEEAKRIEWREDSNLKPSLPPPDPEKAREALELLEQILKFYDHKPQALGVLYWCVQAPLGAVRKQLGRENKILLIYGYPHVGKTTLAKVCGYVWGLREEVAVVSGRITEAQLGERLEERTLPLFLDEGGQVFEEDNIVAILKTTTTGFHSRSRIYLEGKYKRRDFIAYASIGITANEVPDLPEGVLERLLPFYFGPEFKKDDEEYKRIASLLIEHKDLLAFIGSYVRDIVLRNWELVGELLKGFNELEVGRGLLAMLYDELALPRPAWLLQPVQPDREIKGSGLRELLRSTIIREIVEEARKHEPWEVENCLTDFPRWKMRLYCLSGDLCGKVMRDQQCTARYPKRSLLPTFLAVTEHNVRIYSDIRDIIWRHWRKRPSLKAIAEALGGKEEPYRGTRVVYVPLDAFAEFLDGDSGE